MMKRTLLPFLLGASSLLAGCDTSKETPTLDGTRDTPVAISVGDPVKGVVSGESGEAADFFRFRAEAGEKLRITVTTSKESTLDPYVRLYLADGFVLLEKADDMLNGRDAEILFNVDVTGDYLVEVTSFKLVNAPDESDNLATNTYTVAVTRR